MEPILPFTRWVSIQYMTSQELRNLRLQLKRKLLYVPRPWRLPNDTRPETIVLPPTVQPHNCMSCGIKTNWIVWEQIEKQSRRHVNSYGYCLNCDQEFPPPESGLCDGPDSGWGVRELTLNEQLEIEKKRH